MTVTVHLRWLLCVAIVIGVACGGDDTGSGATSGTGAGEGGSSGEGGTGGDAGESGEGGSGGSGSVLPSAMASAIGVGRLHACAITTAGSARCWGYSDHGQRGDGTMLPLSSPAVAVDGFDSGVTQIASSIDHTCAIRNGGVMCWGSNSEGQLGAGHTTDISVPVQVVGLTSDVVAITAGFAHSCAVLSNGTVKCWGSNDDGQLGDDSRDDSDVPVDVANIGSGATAVAAGNNHTCAIVAGGLRCWGSNDYGELGDGSTTLSQVPVNVSGLSVNVTAVSAGQDFTCAIVSGGAKCWGNNRSGQLGDGQGGLGVESHTPQDVSGLSNVTSIAAGYGFACAVAGGGAKCWGSNGDGNLGNGAALSFEATTPVDVSGRTSNISAIAVGSASACALTTAGAVVCWGDNSGGQLGDGTTDRATTPIAVLSLP